MNELLLGIFWALTYLLIVLEGFRFKSDNKFFMPLVAGALNFAWEIHALRISGGYWIHIVWLALDCIILFQNIVFLSTFRKRLLYGICVIASIILIYGVFSVNSFNGMLISSFAIDIIMAIEYVVVIKSISPHLIILIGVCRTLGDLFAWISNLRNSSFVAVIGILVLLVNLFYICYAIDILDHTKQKTSLKKPRKK